MPRDQIPTVFVSLLLASEQYDLYGELQEEALDILKDRPVAVRSNVSGAEGVVLMDCDCVRIALRWTAAPGGNMLTLAIGARPDLTCPRDEARVAADMLRQLVLRAEALFEVRHSVWQVAMLPLVAATLNDHSAQFEASDRKAMKKASEPFVTFQPEQRAHPGQFKETSVPGDLLNSIRNAIDEANAEPSWAMQASTLALSTAFTIVTPPVGIAMFTYAALRQGTDMGLLPKDSDFSPSWEAMGAPA